MNINREKLSSAELTDREKKEVSLWRNIVILILISLIVIFALILIRVLLGDQIRNAGIWIVRNFGYTGMFITTLIIDTLILPVSPDIVLFISIAGNMNVFKAISTITVASMIGGNLGYLIGRFLGHIPAVHRRIEPFEKKGHYLIGKYGLLAVIVGAMTPIPFSSVCWIAGMLEMKYWHFLAGVSWRIPRFLLWYIIIRVGFRGL